MDQDIAAHLERALIEDERRYIKQHTKPEYSMRGRGPQF
jgi:hypothetical protein